ncbi:hypothetical protein IKQ26_10415 [bacterium]|nr:hypothetical protein [bacterium]
MTTKNLKKLFKACVSNLTVDDIDLIDKCENLNNEDEPELLADDDMLDFMALRNSVVESKKDNEVFFYDVYDDWARIRNDSEFLKASSDFILNYIRNHITDYEDEIIDEMIQLEDYDNSWTPHDVFTGALYNMDSLYIEALDAYCGTLRA